MDNKTVPSVTVNAAAAPALPPVRRWHGLAEEWLTGPLGRFLEYGCGLCHLTARVADRCDECHGVDVDAEKIAASRAKRPDFRLAVIGLDGKTSYADGFFDTVAIIEVIEHVADERATLREIARVLRSGGRLVLTTPHRGPLTFLDAGNVKFAFPRLHRFVHVRLRRGRANYERRFADARRRGMVGDITATGARRPWHRHYKPREIIDLCPPELVCERYGVFFPAMRALILVKVVLDVCSFGLVKRLVWPLSWLERRLSRIESRYGDQLVMLFRKRDLA